MPWRSISELAELTGTSTRTVNKRCEGLERRNGDKNAILLESKNALPAIYQLGDDERPDPTKENALLSRERRKKTRVERIVLEGGLVPAEEVVGFCYDMAITIRDKVRSIVPKLRSRYPHTDADLLSDIEDDIDAALTELADDGLPDPLRQRVVPYLSGVQATAETDDKPVG